MRFSSLTIGLLALLTPLATAWAPEDREIFRVRDEIIAEEGADLTFYAILDTTPGASHDEITKAYRMKTRALHPDKVRQTLVSAHKRAKAEEGGGGKASKPPTESQIRAAQRVASEKQARLGVIAEILKGSGRERYDHFLSNGFPVWKGTNYYYDRYRPGLGTAMFGVFAVAGGAFHYLAMYMSWKRQTEFVERYIKFARQTAWGENLGIPGVGAAGRSPATPADSDDGGDEEEQQQQYQPRNRRERRMQERGNRKEQGKEQGKAAPKKKKVVPATAPRSEEGEGGPTGARKRVVAENGKILVVDSLGDVYLEEEDEDGNVEMLLLDPNEIFKPTFRDTAVVRLPIWVLRSTLGRLLPSKGEEEPEADVIVEHTIDDAASDDSGPPQRTPSTGSELGDFEMLEKSVDSLDKAKTTGSQTQAAGGKKRKGRKR